MSFSVLTRIRNGGIHFAYKFILKPILFTQDPEKVHNHFIKTGAILGKSRFGAAITKVFFGFAHPMLEQDILGIHFANPIGLAAGFDKNAQTIGIMPSVGFGFMEVGSITARPCAGNSGKRLFRLPALRALVVNYGLANDGVNTIKKRLAAKKLLFPIGTNIAPTNDPGTADCADAIKDYLVSYAALSEIGAYTTLNLSCPNTTQDQPFANPVQLKKLLAEVKKEATKKPVFLKLSPDLSYTQLDELLSVAKDGGVRGVICSNLTKKRDNPALQNVLLPEKGGISGKIVNPLADAMIKHIAEKWGKTFVIIGCGGVFSAEDAYKKIRLGASLIQLVTGMIFTGPQLASEINLGLVKLLKRDGYSSVSEVVGADIGN